MPHHDDIENPPVFIGELVLTQFAETFIRIEGDRTRRRLQIASEDFHESRFAGTVGPDETITVPFPEFDGNIFEQRLRAELHRDIGGRKHSIPLFDTGKPVILPNRRVSAQMKFYGSVA